MKTFKYKHFSPLSRFCRFVSEHGRHRAFPALYSEHFRTLSRKRLTL